MLLDLCLQRIGQLPSTEEDLFGQHFVSPCLICGIGQACFIMHSAILSAHILGFGPLY